MLFGLGYPVPDRLNRWCTKELKIQPSKKNYNSSEEYIFLTGSHYGESLKRDNRLKKSCGSTECGIDLLKNVVEPIRNWRNCHVWDHLLISDAEGYLPFRQYAKLVDLYAVDSDENGSSRMGCFMCPVVKKEKIKSQVESSIIPEFSYPVRLLLEEMRDAKRILSPRGHLGAILLEERKKFWDKLKDEFIMDLLEFKWIKPSEILMVDLMLEKSFYPPTYSSEHIELAEKRPLTLTEYRNLKTSLGASKKDKLVLLKSQIKVEF